MESISESYVVSQGEGTAKTAFHCHKSLRLKVLLIVAVSLFIWALGGASVQVAGYVCVCILWCWPSAGGAVAKGGLRQPCSGSVYGVG